MSSFRFSFPFYFFVLVCLLPQLLTLIGTCAAQEHNDESRSESAEMSGHTSNSTEEPHHDDEEEPEHEEEEEHHEGEGHYIIWPSMFGMMIFITLAGYLFFHFYSRRQMIKYAKEHHHAGFFEKAIVSSTVTGVAAPGILGFKEKSQKKKKTIRFPKFKSTRKSNREASQTDAELAVVSDQK